MLAPGIHLSIQATQALKSSVFAHCLSVGSLRYCAVMIPWLFSRPAGFITEPTEADTLLRYCAGFQPMSAALRIAWAAAFGVAMLKKTLAPESLSWMTWLSTVGSVTSKVTCLTILPVSLPRPSLKPS